jgi:hypothetical protein
MHVPTVLDAEGRALMRLDSSPEGAHSIEYDVGFAAGPAAVRAGGYGEAVEPVGRRAGGQGEEVAECVEGWRIAISVVSAGEYRKAGGLSGGFGGGGRHPSPLASTRKSMLLAWYRSCLMCACRCECA